jgi:hypothetical protein
VETLRRLLAASKPFTFAQTASPDPVERYDDDTPVQLYWPRRKGSVPVSRLTIGDIAALRLASEEALASLASTAPVEEVSRWEEARSALQAYCAAFDEGAGTVYVEPVIRKALASLPTPPEKEGGI